MNGESQWVTFRVGEEVFGFEIQYVKEMLRMPDVHAVPQAAADNLGVILLREEVISVFDLRAKFGYSSRQINADELTALLRARQQDHENWLRELELCISERREFKLTTDPHQCKFGQWYDNYTTDDPALARSLKRFDQPHRQIHAVGEQVKEFLAREQHAEAMGLVQHTREMLLNALVHVFDDCVKQVQESARSSLILVGTSRLTIGVAVDEIHAVVRCRDEEIQAPDSIPGIEQFGGLIGLLPIKGSNKFTMLLDPAQLYPQLIAPTPELAEA